MIKIVVSSVPWAFDAKPGSRDTWAGFPGERKELFDFMTAENIDGVILISADRHRSDVRKIEREGDYPLYDFLSSRLTNIHTHELLPGSLIQYNEKCSFGEFTFNLNEDDPEIKFVIKSIDNEDKGEVDLRLSDLK